MLVSRSLSGWMTTIGSNHTRLSVTHHRRPSPPNWMVNALLRYALRASRRSPLLQPRLCAKKRLGFNPSWRKAGGHVKFDAAKAYAFVITNWAAFAKVSLENYPAIASMRAKIQARPAVVTAMAAEGQA